MNPRPMLYILDESIYWEKSFLERAGGGIAGAYLFDANRVVHCCSLTGSYEMEPIGSTMITPPDDDELREKLDEEIHACGERDDNVSYFNMFDVDKILSEKGFYCGEKRVCIDLTDKIDDDAWDDAQDADDPHAAYMDAVREHVHGNGYF